MLQLIIFIFAFGLSLSAAARFAEMQTPVAKIAPQGRTTFKLKRILEPVGPAMLKALVIDGQGDEQSLLITRDEAIEVKSGLWIVRKDI